MITQNWAKSIQGKWESVMSGNTAYRLDVLCIPTFMPSSWLTHFSFLALFALLSREIINYKLSHMYEQRTKFILCSYGPPESFTNRRLGPLTLLVVLRTSGGGGSIQMFRPATWCQHSMIGVTVLFSWCESLMLFQVSYWFCFWYTSLYVVHFLESIC